MAMARAAYATENGMHPFEALDHFMFTAMIAAQTAAFNALATVPVRVVPPEATKEMVAQLSGGSSEGSGIRVNIHAIWRDMSAAGDLIKPPEAKT